MYSLWNGRNTWTGWRQRKHHKPASWTVICLLLMVAQYSVKEFYPPLSKQQTSTYKKIRALTIAFVLHPDIR